MAEAIVQTILSYLTKQAPTLLITFISSSIASGIPCPLLRHWSISLGCILSLIVGAAKGVANVLGFFKLDDASAKDAVSKIIGVIVTALVLCLYSPGNVSLDILEENSWSCALIISKVLLALRSIFTNPNPYKPQVLGIAHLYLVDRSKYDALAA
ncbi:uncharacterized protein LOC122196656 [Lactuca sativa]|uniref:uncharacterized protein LOC122196656 n=1 Tax=Lactuca sativa TaxID=4236 RepID=UPI001C692E7B|nr:uncharacterized protein LOC122196656 [Lactuca sativa]